MLLKICGVTNGDDALLAVEAGASYLGFIIDARSPRLVEPKTVRDIISTLPKHVKAVGVVDSRKELNLVRILESGVNVVQLHWSTPERYERVKDLLTSHGLGVALAVNSKARWLSGDFRGVEYLLVDVKDHSKKLELIGWFASFSPPLLGVAGGLRVNNLSILKYLKVDLVDVSSGVEARTGKKDPKLLREFARRVIGGELL